MIKFIKSRRKFVFYYLIVNVILVTILFLTFSAFPTYDTAVIRKDQPYVTELNTTMEIATDGNTLITEKLAIKGVKTDVFAYQHVFSAKDEVVDEASVKIVESDHVLKHTYDRKEKHSVLNLEIAGPFVENETLTVQYKVSGLVKHLRDGQVFQFNPWTSKEIDVANASFEIIMPTEVSEAVDTYNSATLMRTFEQQAANILKTEVRATNHRGSSYELFVWDSQAFVQGEDGLGRSSFRHVDEIAAEIESQIKQVQLEDKKYQMFQYFLRIVYIVLSAIITLVFGLFLLTNFIETQSIKKYLRFEFAPDQLGPGSAAKLIQMRGSNLESAIKAGILYMSTKKLVECRKDKQGLILTKKKEVDIDELEEIIALQKFLFADGDVIHFQKEVVDLETTSRKTMHFFNYRKLIERVVQEYRGNKDKLIHKKRSIFRYMKTEFVIVVSIMVEMILFILLDISTNQVPFATYIGVEVIMVVLALFTSALIPLVYYFSQKDSMNEDNFDVLSEWQYFRTFLFNKKLVREQLMKTEEPWRQFLMYGLAFGAEKTVLLAMKSACPEQYEEIMYGNSRIILDTPEEYFTYSVK